jgi:hypothetical protein
MTARTASVNRFARPLYKSALSGVTDAQWDAFVCACSTRVIQGLSPAQGIGSFDLHPRRLGELGVMVNLRRGRCTWTGDLVPAYADLRINAIRQYEVFVHSMKEYDGRLGDGSDLRLRPPPGASRSGALVILHCGGVGALEAWPERAFATTKALFERSNNLF